MSCFLCCGSSEEEKEEEKKIKDERVRSFGSTSKQPLSAPSALRASRVSSASEDKSEEQKVSQSAEAPEFKDGKSLRTAVRAFTYQELAAVTQNFEKRCLIGEGGFGGVYKGRLPDTRQVVAVKKLDKHGPQGNREFLVEVLMLSLLHHPNLVKLVGYCSEDDQRLLVYEFMPLGSLEDHLHDIPPRKEPLDWNTRMKIAAGAAVGLEYLHNKAAPPVIYRDLKSSNILLGEGYFPKLSDFGLAKLGPVGDRTHVSTRVMGTYGYCAPEYAMTGKLTVKSDIYSFGVVLLEIITGRKAIDYTRPSGEQNLVAWARPLFRDRKNFSKMADPTLQQHYPKRGLYQALAIAAMCVQEQATARPLIEDVVAALNYLTAQVYDPNEVSPRSSRLSPTQRTRENKKNLSLVSGNQHATQSSTHYSPDLQGDLVSESDSARGDDGTGRKHDSIGLHTDESQNDIPMKKTRQSPRNLNRDCDRERAVAEAKLWGENWRERLR